jgi:dipicolinate synthase subunit A
LHAIGAQVRVGMRQSADMARAFEMGLQPFPIAELANYARDADLIFNTVPALVIDEAVLSEVPHDVVILDLASKPGGVDFAYAEKRGIKAILAPSLPGIVAPKTAGKILAKAIIQLMSDVMQKEGAKA